MYLWALAMFFASAGISQIQSRSPCPSASKLQCRRCFSLLRNGLSPRSSPPLPLARQISPRASSSMIDGLKRLSGRIFLSTSVAAFKSSGFVAFGVLYRGSSKIGNISLGVSHRAIPHDFSLLVYSGLNSKSQPFFRRLAAQKFLPFAVIAKVLTPEK